MRGLIFALTHYVAVGLLALIAYVFGRRLTFRVRYHSLLEQASFSIALGLGLLAYLTFVLGLCGLLHPAIVVFALIAGLLLCHRVWSAWLGRALQSRFVVKRKKRVAFIAAAAIVVSPLLILPLYPPTAWDSTEYHLFSARTYVENHALVLMPQSRCPVFPQNNQMLFTLSLLLYDDVSAQLIELLMLAALTAAMVGFGQRFFSARTGLWAGAILLESPLVIWSGSVAYVDVGLMLFSTMTVYALWNYFVSQDRRWLILAGTFCGMAVSTKYPGLFFLLVLAAASLYTGFKRRDALAPLLGIGSAVLIFAPWLVRNFYYTRNPLFPFFSDLFGWAFGYSLWKPEDYRGIFEVLSSLGVGRDLKSLLLLPWDLVVNWRRFGGRISGLPFVVPHLLLVAGVAPKKISWLLVIGVAFTLYWFYTAQDPRYLMPALPFLSLSTGAALASLLIRLPFSKMWTGNKVITALGAILLLSPGLGWSLLRIRERGPLPVTEQQRDAYLTGQLPSYPAYKMLNDLKGRNYTLYALYDERMAYFADGQFLGDHFGLARYSRVLDKITDGRTLYDELKRFGANYFLIRNDLARVDLPQDEFFKSRFKLIYESAGTQLFELSGQPEHTVGEALIPKS